MPEGGLVIVRQSGASSVFPWRVRKGVRRCQGGLFVVVRQSGASSSSPGGSVKVFTDARGVFLIIWQLGASSCSSGGFVKVFADARGACNYMAVRCQLSIPLAGL